MIAPTPTTGELWKGCSLIVEGMFPSNSPPIPHVCTLVKQVGVQEGFPCLHLFTQSAFYSASFQHVNIQDPTFHRISWFHMSSFSTAK